MRNKYTVGSTVPFLQLTSVPKDSQFNALFDIEKLPGETVESYCQALFTKAFNQNNSSIPDFLNHHCSLAKDPMRWLNKFEKLICTNEHLFHEAKRDSRLIKYQTCIELKRNELKGAGSSVIQRHLKKQINAESEDRYFSFRETRQKAEGMENDRDKVYFLTTEIYDYRTADIEMKNSKLPEFDQECEKLIGKIQVLSKMRAEMETVNARQTAVPAGNKIRLNCNVNQFVDIFYQLHYELFAAGKPFINATKSDIVSLISSNFIDKDGNDISPATVETILRPSKDDKRPKSHRRIDLDRMLEKK